MVDYPLEMLQDQPEVVCDITGCKCNRSYTEKLKCARRKTLVSLIALKHEPKELSKLLMSDLEALQKNAGLEKTCETCLGMDCEACIHKSALSKYSIHSREHIEQNGPSGCCCTCKWHRPVYGHPWCNGQSIKEVFCYVCVGGYEELYDHIELRHSHGLGCEMYERGLGNG